MKKNTIKKRLFAVFSVVLLLASLALGCISSAWSFTEAPFYNYFDNTKLQVFETYEHNGYVSGVNAYTGEINLSFKYDGNSGWWTVPYFETNVTLRDLCPEMTVGETYILGGEYNLNNLSLSPPQLIVLHGADFSMQWNFGEAKVVTVDMLNARVTYSFGKVDSNFEINTVYTIYLKLWINKGTVLQDFAPHNLALASYEEGYNNGYNDAKGEILQDYTYISKDNCVLVLDILSPLSSMPNVIEIVDLSDIEYAWDGFSFDSSRLPVGFFEDILKKYEGGYIERIQFIVSVENTKLYTDNITLAMGGRNCSLRADVKAGLSDYVFTYNTGITPSVYYINNASFNSTLNQEITEVRFSFLPTNGNESNFEFSVIFGANNSLSFELGFQNGNSIGYQNGKIDGEKIGFTKGEDVGYQNGYDSGYKNGQYDGYYEGKADEANDGSFFKLVYATIDAPVQVLMDILNFEVFEFNLLNGFISIVSLALCFIVVSYVLKLVI